MDTALERDVIEASMKHHSTTVDLYDYACWEGMCENEAHLEAGECPTYPTVVCAACFNLATTFNDEYAPDEVLAENCPLCSAVDALARWREAQS